MYTRMKLSPKSRNKHIHQPKSFLMLLFNSSLQHLPLRSQVIADLLFLLLQVNLYFSRILYKWNCVVYTYFVLFFHFRDSSVFCVSIVHYFSLPNCIPLYGYTTICSMNIWIGCFLFGFITNYSPTIILVQAFLWTYAFFFSQIIIQEQNVWITWCGQI